MAAFSGKWKLVSNADFEPFLDAVKATPEYREQVKGFLALADKEYYEEIAFDPSAKTLKRTSFIDGKPVKTDGPITIGQEFEDNVHGKPAKITTTLESDTKMKRKEIGSDFTTNGEFEVKGNEMFLTISCDGVTINSKYQRI